VEAEKKQILEMVRDGKLTVEEAQKIMEAMDQGDEDAAAVTATRPTRFLRIRVKDEDGARVNVSVPLSLVRALWRFIPKDAMRELEGHNIDVDSILVAVNEGAQGVLVDVEDEDGTKVEIIVE
jgi:polyhydroxyalkanoate synthesis regulator phasin